MLRFQVDTKQKGLRIKRKSKKNDVYNEPHEVHDRQNEEDNFIDVDVGTPTRLRVLLDNAVAFRLIHQSRYSKLFQIKRDDGDTETLVVRWMDPTSKNSDRDDIAIATVANKSIVPEYEGKERFMHQGTHVSVGVRRYIHGKPLSTIMKRISPEQLDHYKLQVSSMVRELSELTSDYYGAILDGNLKTSTVTGYIASHNMVEKLRDRNYIPSQVIARLQDWNRDAVPRLCHGSLWPEHIIVNGASVEGFVGWSSADFMPEEIDRYLYQLWHVRSKHDQQWGEFLGGIHCTSRSSTGPMAQRDMIEHAQSVAVVRAGRAAQSKIMNKAHMMIREVTESDDFVDSVPPRNSGLSSAETVRDKRSLSALTDETIDTWEKFTVTTEATVT